jgi:caffeoyl-CoA O-methyltransferase
MKTVPMFPELYDYVIGNCPLSHPILAKVEKETSQRKDRGMQISRDQGAFMSMLCKLMGAKTAVEVGCFTGYSAISIATGLAKDGKLYTLDINEETAKIARGYFAEAGLGHKIDLILGDAKASLANLRQKLGTSSVDVAFIDADKVSYPAYYEKILDLLRPNGLIVVDNVMWGGRVVDATDQSEDTVALRKFTEMVSRDERVSSMMLHISDGLLLIRKKDILEG